MAHTQAAAVVAAGMVVARNVEDVTDSAPADRPTRDRMIGNRARNDSSSSAPTTGSRTMTDSTTKAPTWYRA